MIVAISVCTCCALIQEFMANNSDKIYIWWCVYMLGLHSQENMAIFVLGNLSLTLSQIDHINLILKIIYDQDWQNWFDLPWPDSLDLSPTASAYRVQLVKKWPKIAKILYILSKRAMQMIIFNKCPRPSHPRSLWCLIRHCRAVSISAIFILTKFDLEIPLPWRIRKGIKLVSFIKMIF